MKGNESKIISYIGGPDKKFVIPVYQRNYDWKKTNCAQLYDDLVAVVRKGRPSHFFGSIVSVGEGDWGEHLVIDGQQRLTTISLLVLAMYKLMTHNIVQSENPHLCAKLWETVLIDVYENDESKRLKLRPVKNDQDAYRRLFDEASDYNSDSNMTQNYTYFYKRIQKQEITIDQLYEAICKLEIINITLGKDDEPQLIFESLNATGLALSEGDKIRNFILMGLPLKQQEIFYLKYWNKIEQYTDYDASSFIRDYLSVKQHEIPQKYRVYAAFKTYIEELEVDCIESLLKDMLCYAKRYNVLLYGRGKNDALDKCIYRLKRLETTVTRPFFLEVLRLKDEDKLNEEEIFEVFTYTENYLFRRIMCDLRTNVLNKLFLRLHLDIVNCDGTDDNYIANFKYILLSKKEGARFPDDEEFKQAISTRQVYNMTNYRTYLLERLENSNTVEDKEIYKFCDDGTYTIEHIMPQKPTYLWKKELGENYEQIHETWQHRLANLTLTGYNSKYSNKPFKEKRDCENGFKDSGLRLNAWIARQEKWGVQELEERNQKLMQLAVKIWSRPQSGIMPPKKEQFDSCTLVDDVDLRGRSISRFAYKNVEQTVRNWVDMQEQVLKILHAEDKLVLVRLANSSDASSELDAYVSNDPKKVRSAMKIDEDIYVEKNTSTAAKINMLQKFFKAYGADPEDLVFFLAPAQEETNAADALPLSEANL